MANNPHDKAGKQCTVCMGVFQKSSLALTIPGREGNLIVHKTVCPKCHHKHYSRGE